MDMIFILKEGIVSLKRARMSAVVAVTAIALSLTLLAVFAVAGLNLNTFFNIYKQVQLEVFLEPGIRQSRLNSLKSAIADLPQVGAVEYINAEEALAEFKKSFGEDIATVLDENPLPPS
ncbi:MAG: permease-like cell division protein FtsX, partial [Calditrichia bacterium]